MDLNDLRSIATVTAFVAFMGIVVWAMSRRRQPDFDAAAQLPLLDDEAPASRQSQSGEIQ